MLTTEPKVTIFIGPSAEGVCHVGLGGTDISWTGPVGHGDLKKRMAEAKTPGIFVIVDGWFYRRMAITHSEIRSAMNAGWAVWGLAGMGAIRAYEMRHLGMFGFGTVYQQLLENPELKDDQLLFEHVEEPPYRRRTESVLDYREALSHLLQRQVISRADADRIVEQLSRTWFNDRTIEAFASLLLPCTRDFASSEVKTFLTDFHTFRLGPGDVQRFLKDRPWTGKS